MDINFAHISKELLEKFQRFDIIILPEKIECRAVGFILVPVIKYRSVLEIQFSGINIVLGGSLLVHHFFFQDQQPEIEISVCVAYSEKCTTAD